MKSIMDNGQIKILVTGASGFIGSFLCEEGLKRRMAVWAGMRKSSRRQWLQNEWLQFQTLDMTDRATLAQQLTQFKQKHGRWDIIVHAAGATKCLDPADFDRNNYDCTVNLVETLRQLDMVPKLFVYVSSLSVVGPAREAPSPAPTGQPLSDGRASIYDEITAADTPHPNTAYGQSKLRSEQYLQSLDFLFPYVIFRPTGVYGPREKDYFLQAKSVKQHIDFAVGYRRQEITFVYVQDLVDAIFAAVEKAQIGQVAVVERKIYHVSDGRAYSSRAFSDLIQRELGVAGVLHIKAPLWFLRCVCAVSDWWSRRTKRVATLNNDKYKILSQRNWQCDISPLRRDLGFTPQWPLERGTAETVAWYRKNHWL